MAQVKKFLFDRSFDEDRPGRTRRANDAGGANKDAAAPGAAAGEPDAPADAGADQDSEADAAGYAGLDRRRRGADTPAPPPAEVYSAADLAAARDEGYVNGHTAALEEAAKTDSHVSANALKTIEQALDTMEAAQADFHAAMERQAVRLALTITRRLLPATGEQAMAAEIESLAARVLPDLMDQPRLMVRVNGAIADTMRTALRDLKNESGFEGRVMVRPDNTLKVGDCRLEWGEGGIDRDSGRLWAEIEAAVSRHLNEPVPVPEPVPEPEPEREAEPVERESPSEDADQSEGARRRSSFFSGRRG